MLQNVWTQVYPSSLHIKPLLSFAGFLYWYCSFVQKLCPVWTTGPWLLWTLPCDTEIRLPVVCAIWSETLLSIPNWLIYALYQKTMVKFLLALMGKKKKEFVLHSSENPALVLSLLPLAIYIYAKICWLISVRVMYKQSRAKLAVRPIKVSQTLGKKKKNRNLSSFANILLKTPTDTVSKEVKYYQEGDVYTVVFLYLVHASEICIPKWSPPA